MDLHNYALRDLLGELIREDFFLYRALRRVSREWRTYVDRLVAPDAAPAHYFIPVEVDGAHGTILRDGRRHGLFDQETTEFDRPLYVTALYRYGQFYWQKFDASRDDVIDYRVTDGRRSISCLGFDDPASQPTKSTTYLFDDTSFSLRMTGWDLTRYAMNEFGIDMTESERAGGFELEFWVRRNPRYMITFFRRGPSLFYQLCDELPALATRTRDEMIADFTARGFANVEDYVPPAPLFLGVPPAPPPPPV